MIKDTAGMTVVSLILQGMGLFLNAYISDKLGTASVGVMTLIFTLFGFIMVLAGGNIFIATSRFTAEETGCGCRNLTRIMGYCLRVSVTLSVTFTVLCFILSGKISELASSEISLAEPVRIIALSLPLASVGACIKGYFNSAGKISITCLGDCIEFSAKWVCLLFSVLFLFPKGYDIYFLIAVSILIGEGASFVFYLAKYIPEYRVFSKYPQVQTGIASFRRYIKLYFPILLSGYVQMILSTANDTLVPIMLVKYNSSSERAMSEYGMFEAMIIPAIFYPSTLLCSLSSVLMPEIAAAYSSGNIKRVRHLADRALSGAFLFSFFVSGLFFMQGKNIGTILCPSDPLVGDTLVKMFPVIPFIYLEIILESILKGLGKQNFSTVNSFCEYAIRILCVVIFVDLYGFTGVLISYYASNIYSNIIRIIVVCKVTGIKFSIKKYAAVPLFYTVLSCTAAYLITKLVCPVNAVISAVVFICAACINLIAVPKSRRIFGL
jgi:stage V sporulation protein B